MDPVFIKQNFTNIIGANALISTIRQVALNAGWVVDEYDTTPSINSQNGGHELYIRTNRTGFSQQARFSLKALAGSAANHQGVAVYQNTGYNNLFRVDNQPGMFVRHCNDVVNGAPWVDIFSGLWDNTGINADPSDKGLYKTPGALTPSFAANVPHLNTLGTSPITVYTFYDTYTPGSSSNCIIFIWYINNQMYGLCIGRVLYDNEGVAPDNVDGFLMAAWTNNFNASNSTNPPNNNSTASTRTVNGVNDAPFAIIRNRTVGGTTWPAGTPNGNILARVGPVVLNSGRIEASENFDSNLISAICRPDMGFDAAHNNVQSPNFPNPRITVHYETYDPDARYGFARFRHLSRWPNGGALTGSFVTGVGVNDWADSHFFFPWYFASTLGLAEDSLVSEGSRQMASYPGNRGGVDPFATYRAAGIALRIQ